MPSRRSPSATRAGDSRARSRDYGDDEIGTVARALDDSVREIGQRAAELESDRARMEAILAGMIEGVLVVNEQGRLQLVNEAARRMLQLAGRAPTAGTTSRSSGTRTSRRRSARRSRGTHHRGPRAGAAARIRTAASSRAARPVALRGRARGAVLVLHDITELRRADRIRRDFVANVSHELRTPLTAIRGYVEALLDGGTDTPDARRFLEIIGRHTLRMERLVRDLLRLARLDAGQEPLEHVPLLGRVALRAAWRPSWPTRSKAREQVVERQIARGRRDGAGRSGEAARRAAQPARERVELLARRRPRS